MKEGCPLTNSVNYLKKKGALEDARRIKDLDRFKQLNSKLTSIAYFTYGVGDGTIKLFDSKLESFQLLDGSYKTIIRAIPNKKMFDLLEIQIENVRKRNEEVDTKVDDVDNLKNAPMQDVSELLGDMVDESVPEAMTAFDILAQEYDSVAKAESLEKFVLFNNEDKLTFTAMEVFENIKTNFKGFSNRGDEVIERLGVLIGSVNSKVRIMPAKDRPNEDTYMLYDGNVDTIYVYPQLFDSTEGGVEWAVQSMLHEMVHGVTARAYRNPQGFEQQQFKELIDLAFERYYAEHNKEYGFKNPVEFIAEIYSNPAFRQVIQEKQDGIWSRITNAIRRIFGLKSTPSINTIINSIIDIAPTKQVAKGSMLFEIKKERETVSQDTSEKKVNLILEGIINSISETLDELHRKEPTDSIQNLISTNDILRENISRYQETGYPITAIHEYTKAVIKSMNSLNDNVLSNVDINDTESIKKIIEAHQTYLQRYGLLESILKTLTSIYDAADSPASKEEIDIIKKDVSFAFGEFTRINERMTNFKEKVFRDRINNIAYFPEVEYKHKERLRKEHVETGIVEDQDSWVSNMLVTRDKELVQNDLDQKITQLLENPAIDIYTSDVWTNTAINVSSELINILNVMLYEVDSKRIAAEREKDRELESAFNDLVKSKGSRKPSKLYKNIVDVAKNGQQLILGRYNIAFYNDWVLGRKEIVKKFEDQINKLEEERMTINKTIDPIRYDSVIKNIRSLEEQQKAALHDLRIKIFKSDAANSAVKDKYLNTAKLSKEEQVVKDLFIDILDQTHKATYRPKSDSPLSLIKTYGLEDGNWITFYELPKINKSQLERMLEGDGKGLVVDKLKDLTQLRSDDVGYAPIRKDQAGNIIKNLRVHYRDYTGNFNVKDQSMDLFTIMRLEYKNGNMFRIRKGFETDLNFLLDIAKNKEFIPYSGTQLRFNTKTAQIDRINGGAANTTKMLNNMLEQRFYDIMKTAHPKFAGADLNKLVTFINSSSAFLALSLNYASATANVVNGSTQIFLESLWKSTDLNANSVRKANAIYTKNIGDILRDVTAPIDNALPNQITELFNARGLFNLSHANFLASDLIKKGLTRQALQVFQESGEHWMQSVITMGVLDTVKVMNANSEFINKEGKVVKSKKEAASLLDMIEKKDGYAQVSDKVVYTTKSYATKWNEGGKEKISLLIRKKLDQMIGNYTETDQPELMRTTGGPLLYLYRKYLFPMGLARLRGFEHSYKKKEDLEDHEKRFSYALQEYEEGTYTTFVRYVIQSIKDKQYNLLSQKNWNKLSDYEKQNIKKAITEFTFMFVLLPLAHHFIAIAAQGSTSADDNEYLFFVAYQLRRLDTELSQYHNPAEFFKLLRSPIPSVRLLESSMEIMGGVFDPMSWTEEYVRGPHEGQNKLKVKVQKQLPVLKEFKRSFNDLYEYQKSSFIK